MENSPEFRKTHSLSVTLCKVFLVYWFESHLIMVNARYVEYFRQCTIFNIKTNNLFIRGLCQTKISNKINGLFIFLKHSYLILEVKQKHNTTGGIRTHNLRTWFVYFPKTNMFLYVSRILSWLPFIPLVWFQARANFCCKIDAEYKCGQKRLPR